MHLRKKHLFQELPFIKTIMMFTVFGRDQYRNTQTYRNQYTNLQEIMGWESSDVFRFDLGAFFQGQMTIVKLKCAFNLSVKPT